MRLLNLAVSYLLFSVLYLCCFALAVAVCGLYGTDIHNGNEAHVHSDGKWVYAVVVGVLSAVTCLVYFIPLILRVGSFITPIWNFILFVLWIALFGLFGNMYIKEHAEGVGGIKRMKNAVWVDLASALLWLIATIASAGYWWQHRDRRSQFTGRAHV